MKTKARPVVAALAIVIQSAVCLSSMIVDSAFGDFLGSDSLAAPNSQWSYIHDGGGEFYSQNSRLEFVVSTPTTANSATLFWEANRGAYNRSWYLQVDTDLAMVPLADGSATSLSLSVGNASDGTLRQIAGIYSERIQTGGLLHPLIAGYTDWGFFKEVKCTSRFVTLRLHFDSKEKTLTGSWNPGTGWRYLPPQSIARWGMTDKDQFYAFLYGSNLGPSADSLALASGNAHFRNFKTGPAKPDIGVEQPAEVDLTDGKGRTDFGKASTGIGRVRKTFTLRNSGTAALTGLKITNKGANPADYTVTQPGKTSIPPGGSTTFKVTFKPKAGGVRSTVLRIISNDAGESPFDIKLTGRGVK